MFLREPAMMQHMMDGGMMWGMGVGGLIALILLVNARQGEQQRTTLHKSPQMTALPPAQ
jgi:hypothetical protein